MLTFLHIHVPNITVSLFLLAYLRDKINFHMHCITNFHFHFSFTLDFLGKKMRVLFVLVQKTVSTTIENCFVTPQTSFVWI